MLKKPRHGLFQITKQNRGYSPLCSADILYKTLFYINLSRFINWLGGLCVAAIFAALSGCATTTPPSQEMSDARQALDAAHQVDAARHVPETLQGAENLLSKAETKLGEGAFEQAQRDALAAKEEATKARTMAAAISAAKLALQEAAALDALSGEAQALLQQAEAAALVDDDKNAVGLADQAKQRAGQDINNKYLRQARALLDEAAASGIVPSAAHGCASAARALQPFPTEQHAAVQAAEDAYCNNQGKMAYDVIHGVMAALREAQRRHAAQAVIPPPPAAVMLPRPVAVSGYVVARGDSLWKIAARPDIYGNPLRWRVIYKTNRRQIKNVNVIYPGQLLKIQR